MSSAMITVMLRNQKLPHSLNKILFFIKIIFLVGNNRVIFVMYK
jgi:hypothetical protein